MKVTIFLMLVVLVASYSSNSNAQISHSCEYSQNEESKLLELSKTNENADIDSSCIGKRSFFKAATDLEKIRTLPILQKSVLIGVAIEKLEVARNIWAMEKLSLKKFNENQIVTWGQIVNLYKTKTDLYFVAQDKKNDVQINSPQKYVFFSDALNRDVSDAKDDWTIFGYKIPVENMANHIIATSHQPAKSNRWIEGFILKI